MASGSESAKEEHYHNLTSKQREQILGKIYFKIQFMVFSTNAQNQSFRKIASS